MNAPASGATNPGRPTIFLSYSHRDERWKDRLLAHLGIAAEEGLLAAWNDRQIGAGADWLQKIQEAIEAARVAVILISANFLTSRFIRGTEVPQILEVRATRGLQIFPVIVRSCDWQIVPWLSPLQARPRDGKALAAFGGDRVDAELALIAKEIREMLRSGAAPVSMFVPESPVSHLPAAKRGQAPSFPRGVDPSGAPTGSSDVQGRPSVTKLGESTASPQPAGHTTSVELPPESADPVRDRVAALSMRWRSRGRMKAIQASIVLGAVVALALGGLTVARYVYGWPPQIDPTWHYEAMRSYDGEAGYLAENKARRLVESAARQGDELAEMWKARSLYLGVMGYKKDEEKGQSLARTVIAAVERRAKRGDPLAVWLLGEGLKDGIGVEPNPNEAAKWLEKACTGRERVLVACANLGNLYAMGDGVLPDPARAALLYGIACDGGDLTACLLQGNAYDLGSGVAPDRPRAEHLYDRACTGRVYPACVKQGILLETGSGVPPNPGRALELYAHACDAGVSTGCAHLKLTVGARGPLAQKATDQFYRLLPTGRIIFTISGPATPLAFLGDSKLSVTTGVPFTVTAQGLDLGTHALNFILRFPSGPGSYLFKVDDPTGHLDQFTVKGPAVGYFSKVEITIEVVKSL